MAVSCRANRQLDDLTTRHFMHVQTESHAETQARMADCITDAQVKKSACTDDKSPGQEHARKGAGVLSQVSTRLPYSTTSSLAREFGYLRLRASVLFSSAITMDHPFVAEHHGANPITLVALGPARRQSFRHMPQPPNHLTSASMKMLGTPQSS